MNNIDDDPIAQAAIKKVKIERWYPYIYEAATGGVLVTGVVPKIISRGPNKGWPTARGADKSTERKVVITKKEIDAAQRAIDRRLGKAK